MSIEDRYLSGLIAVQYPDAPVEPSLDGMQLAAGPSQTVSDAGGGVRVGRAGVPYKPPSMRDITEPAGALLDMGAATVKGATQGFIGLPGDLENIGRMVLGAMGVQAGEKTVLPTTDEVKAWLDTNVGKVGNGQNPYESIGEVTAPGGQVKAVKAAGRGAKALAPKAAEMVVNATEKTGMPVRGLGIVEDTSYRGSHTAPDREFGATLDDLTGGGQIYPADVYSAKGSHIYGDGQPYDRKAFEVAYQVKGKPDATVTIYRAVPKEMTNSEKLSEIETQMAKYMSRGTLPPDSFTDNGSKWYEWAAGERDRLKQLPDEPVKEINKINPGDWVTITRDYAKDHGESALRGKYKIISMKVKAKDIYTNGDSIHEWGYDPANKGKE